MLFAPIFAPIDVLGRSETIWTKPRTSATEARVGTTLQTIPVPNSAHRLRQDFKKELRNEFDA